MLETSFHVCRYEVIRTLIFCPPTAERQKIGFDPICYGTAVTVQRQVGMAMAQGIFYVGNVILTVLTEFLRNLCNGNGETAERQRNGGHQA